MLLNSPTQNELLDFLSLPETDSSLALEIAGEGAPRYLRELKMNLKTTLQSVYLSEKETSLLALAVAAGERSEVMIRAFRTRSIQAGASPEEIAGVVAAASLMAANNVLYRFRHFMQKESYQQMPARLRMNQMLNPGMSKEFFELISLAISAVNGCEACVRAHEQSLLTLGCSQERIFDAIRLASVVVSLGKLV